MADLRETGASPRIFEWPNKKGIQSGFLKSGDILTRTEFGSLAEEDPSLNVRIMQNGHTIQKRVPTLSEAQTFLNAVEATIPDAPILSSLREAVTRLEESRE